MNVHYGFDADQNVRRTLTEDAAVPYIIQRDGKDWLCVIEGGAYHQFEIGPRGLHRLASECSSRLWSLAQQ